ncbi:hypothetical protein ACE1B6_02480 [Aerosakkonemataceae cyanobacterium BLCC-F154]|uniref:Uncharacterized protein n=1 Tax=Floridaenema fluviatile BLCC-F154 TaxID=3153640 RepID=A0ABV4Y5P0_9CYAN
MKELPDEKILLEMLEVFKDAEVKAREMSELATAIAFKYQKRMREIRGARQQQAGGVE